MIILVDLDGPMADFDAAFFKRCDREGFLVDCTPEEQRHRFATDHLPNKHERARARDIVNNTRWFRDLPVVAGSREGLEELAVHAEVWLCTKPLEANPWCRDDKAAWVEQHYGEDWLRRLIITPDKAMIHGDVLLDDAPRAAWYERASWTPVIFPTTWNGHGSEWAGLPRWRWGDPVESLLAHGR